MRTFVMAVALLLAVPALVAAAALTAMALFGEFHDRTAVLPGALAIASTEFHGECTEESGAIVYRLTEASRQALQRQGLAMLREARQSRETDRPLPYEAWHELPPDVRSQNLDCAGLPHRLATEVEQARRSAFFTEGHKVALFADAVSGLVVYRYGD
jgi:hypothetical protein